MNYGRDRGRKEIEKYFNLQNKIRNISQKIAEGKSDYVDLSYFEHLKNELSTYEQKKCRGANFRSKAYWAIDSDKSTKYFLNLEKFKQENICIKELNAPEGTIYRNNEDFLKLEYEFYSNLYSCVHTDIDKTRELVHNIDNEVVVKIV